MEERPNENNENKTFEERLFKIEHSLEELHRNVNLFDLNEMENRVIALESQQKKKRSILSRTLSFSNIIALAAILLSLFQFYRTEQKEEEASYEVQFKELSELMNDYRSQQPTKNLNLLSRIDEKIKAIENKSTRNNKRLTHQQKVLLSDGYGFTQNYDKAYPILNELLDYYLDNDPNTSFFPQVIFAHFACSQRLDYAMSSWEKYEEYAETRNEIGKKQFWFQIYLTKAGYELQNESYEDFLLTLVNIENNICPVCENLYPDYLKSINYMEFAVPERIKRGEKYTKVIKRIHKKLEK